MSALKVSFLRLAFVLAAVAGAAPAFGAPATPAAASLDGANTAWMLVSTVLVLLMTMPGIMLFYSGMLRTRNTLSIMAQTIAGIGVITVMWAAVGYSLAFTPGNAWIGDLRRVMAEGLIGGASIAIHPIAPTIPESVFFLYQMAFAIITFAIILGATAERLRIGASMVFGAIWLVLVYAPVAHWVWHPNGWLAAMGHMDFAGGTVVHIQAGAAGLAAAIAVGPRQGFGKQPMVPHNLALTVLGAGLLWAGWFGFNAGSSYEASARAAGALLATQLAAGAGALCWGVAEMFRRQQMSVLGMATGAIAGLIAVTPASGYVGVGGALAIGAIAGVVCFAVVTTFKHFTHIDDSLDVFALHGVGGVVGTVLTPVFALKAIAPITADVATNALGAAAVMAYTGLMTWGILKGLDFIAGLRVNPRDEHVGLDLSQHGESLAS
ncbi:MAG: ammonium transporter [Proteobacteria bacterium]|jgi:Amt family ammonium transporter|nr:ammonium transporter [Ramlibacter sp.]MCA0212883.1 ammonium transporter [Pseudomonadota bacterium]